MTLALLFMFISGVSIVYVNCRNTTSEDVISAANLILMPDGSVEVEIVGKNMRIIKNEELTGKLGGLIYAVCPESFKSAAEIIEAALEMMNYKN